MSASSGPLQLAAAIALCAACTLHPPLHTAIFQRGAWCGMTIVLVLEGSFAATWRKGILRIIGTVVGGLAAITIILSAAVLPNVAMQAIAVILLLSMWCGVVKWVQERHVPSLSYACTVANLTAVLLVLAGQGRPDLIHFTAAERMWAVAVGVAMVSAAGALVFPIVDSKQVTSSLASAIQGIGQLGETALLSTSSHLDRKAVLQQGHATAKLVLKNLAQAEAAIPLMKWQPALLFPVNVTATQGMEVIKHLRIVNSLLISVLDMTDNTSNDEVLNGKAAALQLVSCTNDLQLMLEGEDRFSGRLAIDEFWMTAHHFGDDPHASQLSIAISCILQCVAEHFKGIANVLHQSTSSKED